MGDSKTRLYGIWQGIKRRCLNPNYHHFSDYGGRGVGICDSWLEFENFKKWALQNGYTDDLTIERKDNEKGYSPENCVWADRVDQNNNTRRNHFVEYLGGLYTIAELSRICGISQNTLLYRIRRGWSVEDAANKPVEKRCKPIGKDLLEVRQNRIL